MILYNYDKQGCYLGSSEAFLDKLETRKKGENVWLIAANSTTIAPPVDALPEFTSYQFIDGAWGTVVDYRGEMAYQQAEPYGNEMVNTVGPLIDGWSLTPPVIPEPEV